MKAVFAWLKAHWRLVVAALFVLLGAVVTYEVIRAVTLGKAEKPKPFYPLGKDQVLVQVGGQWKQVTLPAGVTSDKVKAVDVTPAGSAVVEVHNASLDQT